jgi:mono/diheme cytochrome c family protein
MKRLFGLVAIVLPLIAANARAQTLPGDANAGYRFAQRLCADCHDIGRQPAAGAGGAAVGAPAFAEIARGGAMSELSLRAFLQKPHLPMPNLALTRGEIDDALSYILSLRRP